MNILSSGGFGDSLMIYAKYAHLDKNAINVVHVEPYQNTLENVSKFLKSNSIKHKCVRAHPFDYYKKNNRVFQYAYSSYAYGKNSGATHSSTGQHFPPAPHKQFDHEIDPFPSLKYNIIGGADIVVAISSGRDSTRLFSPMKIIDIVKRSPIRKITLIGKVSEEIRSLYRFSYKNIYNLINKTTVEEAMDIVGSCSEFYGHAGFFAYFAAMCQKRVYMVPEICSVNYIHKKWDLKLIGV